MSGAVTLAPPVDSPLRTHAPRNMFTQGFQERRDLLPTKCKES
jgi:hypothetical protein